MGTDRIQGMIVLGPAEVLNIRDLDEASTMMIIIMTIAPRLVDLIFLTVTMAVMMKAMIGPKGNIRNLYKLELKIRNV
jgi:hypothetical protein